MTTLKQLHILLGTSLCLAAGATAKPVKVFIMAGQSNMDGQADVRTIDFLGEDKDPARAALLKTFKPDGKTLVTRDDVWVASGTLYDKLQTGFGGRRDYTKLGTCIGPEYAFGYYMGEALDEQVLLIKYGPGGTSLLAAWRPPSAGPTGDAKADAAELDQATVDKWFGGHGGKVIGCQYRYLVNYVHETLDNLKKHFPAYNEKDGYEIAGFVWFQGYNDLGCTKEDYSRALVCLIKDLRTEFKAPDMKAVVGVLGVNGVKNEGGKQVGVRGGQRSINTVPEFKGNARAIESAPLLHPDVVALNTAGWLNMDRDLKKDPITEQERAMLQRATSNKGFHYFGEGRFFILLGKAFADTMLELSGKENKVLPPALNTFAPPDASAAPAAK
jgi:alpha-galactosidase